MGRRETADDLDDLYRPTLSASDDVARADKPWDPSSLWVATFFGGGIAGALLFGLNAKRLGVPRQALWLAPTLFAAAVAALVAIVVFEARLADNERIVSRIVGVALGAIGWSVQRRRFRTVVAAGGEPGKALLPSLAAIAGAIALHFAFAFVYVMFTAVENSAS